MTTKKVNQSGKMLPRSCTEFEYMIKINGIKIAAVLETGSPINMVPASPKKVIINLSERQFVDVNEKPNKINNRYELETDVNGVTKKLIWWAVNSDTKPIIDMGGSYQLGVQIMQRKVKKGDLVLMEPRC